MGTENKERTAAWFAGFLPAIVRNIAFAAVYEGDVGSKVHGGTSRRADDRGCFQSHLQTGRKLQTAPVKCPNDRARNPARPARRRRRRVRLVPPVRTRPRVLRWRPLHRGFTFRHHPVRRGRRTVHPRARALPEESGRGRFPVSSIVPLNLRFFFDTEIIGIELVDLRHVVAGQLRTLRRFGELNQLLLVINIRQRRRDAVILEQPEQCGLAECSVRMFQEPKLFDFLDSRSAASCAADGCDDRLEEMWFRRCIFPRAFRKNASRE